MAMLLVAALGLSTDGPTTYAANKRQQDSCMIMNEDSHAWGGVHKAAWSKDDDDDDDDDAEGDEELTVRGCKRGGDRSASERRRMKTLPRATRAPPCGKPPGAQTSVSNGDLD